MSARGLDFADMFKANAGIGLGLTFDVHISDYISPGIGVASYTWNFGYDTRDVYGFWEESDVINTPRLAFELLAEEYEATPSDQLDPEDFLARLALSSLNLPNERWIRSSGVVTVEFFSLFNFRDLSSDNKLKSLTGHILTQGDDARLPEKTVWERSFIEVGGTAGFVSARIGFNPAEFVDFLAGFAGFDPADDDDNYY